MILAGGRGSRMGGQDKGLLPVHGKPMISLIIERLQSQAGQLIINANRNLSRYREFGFPVISDDLEGFQGPLAGILAGLKAVHTPWMLCVPCDVPRPPRDLALRLAQALKEKPAKMAVVHDGEKLQPAFALIASELGDDLAAYMQTGGRKLRQWCATHHPALADYSHAPRHFRNINSQEELDIFLRSGS